MVERSRFPFAYDSPMRAAWLRKLAPPLAALAIFLVSARASANVAFVRRDDGSPLPPLPNARFPRESSLVLEDALFTFDCASVGDQAIECAFDERLRIYNPSPQPEDVVAAVIDDRSLEEIVVRIDGLDAVRALSPVELEALDAAVIAVGDDINGFDPKTQLAQQTHRGFSLVVAPSGRREIVVTARLRRVGSPFGLGPLDDILVMSAVHARHLFLWSEPTMGESFTLDVVTAYLRTLQGVPSAHLRVVHPSSLAFEAPKRAVAQPLGGGRAIDTVDLDLAGDARARADAIAHDAIDHSTWRTWFGLTRSPPPIELQNGGALVGVGGARGEAGGFRLKAGYEVAAPSAVFYQLSLESDLTRRTFVVPMIEAASPEILFVFPSFGLGLGAPIQLAPQPRVGGRLQLDLHFLSLGFVTALDLFPGTAASPHFTQATFLGQIGL